jgi:phage head maturation protease
VDDEDMSRENGDPIRTIKSVTLYDVGPVTYPAYSGTSCSATTRQWLRALFEDPRRVRMREAEQSIKRDEQKRAALRLDREAFVAVCW